MFQKVALVSECVAIKLSEMWNFIHMNSNHFWDTRHLFDSRQGGVLYRLLCMHAFHLNANTVNS